MHQELPRRAPVTIVAVVHYAVLCTRIQIVHPSLHVVETVDYQGLVAVELVGIVGKEKEAGTDRIRRPCTETERSHAGDCSVRTLSVNYIPEKLREESCHVEVVECRLHADGKVIEPAHPFIALRAVCWHAVEVGSLRVEHHRVDVVQKGIAAVEAGSPFHGRADHPDLDVIDRRSLLQTIYLDKTETVVGELRLPGELLIGRRDEAVLALGIAEIVLVDKTVVPESFSIAESDLLSAHSGNLQGDPSGKVAAGVNNIDTRLRL